jgi:hypothetical protein
MPPATTTEVAAHGLGEGPLVAERPADADDPALVEAAERAGDRADGANRCGRAPSPSWSPLVEIGTSPTPNA